MKKQVLIVIIMFFIIISFTFFINHIKKEFSVAHLIQLSTTTNDRMMGYIVKTNKNKIIVIDGGNYEDGKKLESYIRDFGGEVEKWFITHYHNDHTGAIRYIINETDINIKNIYSSLNTREEVEKYELERLENYDKLIATLNNVPDDKKVELKVNDTFFLDNVKVEILGIRNPEITANIGNNSSVVLRFDINNNKSILFLGDTGVESQKKLMSNSLQKLDCDYVQMAHHGQNGVNEDMYKAISPKVCLWPTPKWLFDNDNGKGYNSGNWTTLETRKWISKMNVKSYYFEDGDILIKID